MSYFHEFSRYIKSHNIDTPIGCSLHEISQFENEIGFKLPIAYKDYLLLMGNDYKGVMVGTECFLSDVKSNNDYLPEFLIENGLSNYVLPDKYLAFFCHQGYMMAWFSLPCNDDDPVCNFYFEGTTDKPEEFGLFSEFMSRDMLGNARLRVGNRRLEKARRDWWKFWK